MFAFKGVMDFFKNETKRSFFLSEIRYECLNDELTQKQIVSEIIKFYDEVSPVLSFPIYFMYAVEYNIFSMCAKASKNMPADYGFNLYHFKDFADFEFSVDYCLSETDSKTILFEHIVRDSISVYTDISF